MFAKKIEIWTPLLVAVLLEIYQSFIHCVHFIPNFVPSATLFFKATWNAITPEERGKEDENYD